MTRPDRNGNGATPWRGVLAALAALLLAVGFAAVPAVAQNDTNDTNATNATNVTEAGEAPAIEILHPMENETLLLEDGNATVSAEVLVNDFNLTDAFREGAAAENGTGHIHYWLQPQNATVSETCFSLAGNATSLQEALANNATAFNPDVGNESVPADVLLNGTGPNATVAWVNWANTTLNITGVAPGAYVLCTELVNNDHTSLSPPVADAVNFTVGANETGQVTTLNETNATNGTNGTNASLDIDNETAGES